jgi:hypothetical protein
MKYKKDFAYKGIIPLSNIMIDSQYNPDIDTLFVTIKDLNYPNDTKMVLALKKNVREQLRDCLNVEYEHSK